MSRLGYACAAPGPQPRHHVPGAPSRAHSGNKPVEAVGGSGAPYEATMRTPSRQVLAGVRAKVKGPGGQAGHGSRIVAEQKDRQDMKRGGFPQGLQVASSND